MRSRRTARRLWTVAVALRLGMPMLRAPAANADPATLRERHATILVKALSYDEKFVERADKEVVVAILYRAAEAGSADEAEAWRQSFDKLAALRFLGLPFRAVRRSLGSPEQLAKGIAQEGIDALFVLGMSKEELDGIQKVARRQKVLTLASREEQVNAGLSLGVFVIDGKTSLVINLAASREEGAVFSSEILKLAKVIR
jgi:hypothetical protein